VVINTHLHPEKFQAALGDGTLAIPERGNGVPDILDEALLRPGRFDRIIEIPLPTVEARREIFRIHTRKMSIEPEVEFDALAARIEGATGADIKAISTEAGMFAIREDRTTVSIDDFDRAVEKVLGNNLQKLRDVGAMYA